jgi:hypothetical protein
LLGANKGSGPLLPFWSWAKYRSGRGDSVYVAGGGKGGEDCAEDMKIWLRVLNRNKAQTGDDRDGGAPKERRG